MTNVILDWLLTQGPTVAILSIIGWLLWNEMKSIRLHQQQMLDQCWQRILDCLDDDEP